MCSGAELVWRLPKMLGESGNAAKVGRRRWLWVRCESGDPPASAVVMWSPRNSPFVVHHITNGRRTEGEQAARPEETLRYPGDQTRTTTDPRDMGVSPRAVLPVPEETLRYPGDQTRTTTDARRSDAGRLSSTSFMLHYLPTPRERCDGCHFANYPA